MVATIVRSIFDQASAELVSIQHQRVMEQLEELSEFLRSRRARISPATIGLPDGRRRRTPGLRREEVASLAGVGLT